MLAPAGDIDAEEKEPTPTAISSESDKSQDSTPLTTWVFEHNSFVPQAKIVGDKTYSIVCDYLGTPVQAFNENGENVWDCELDIYGNIRNIEGSKTFIPFRYQGQYEDEETGLYYNRFRYYSPDSGTYVSQDPIGLNGSNPNLYGYVADINFLVDPVGLSGMPSGGWNFHNMPKIDGFQNHHIIPKSLKEGKNPHEIFDLSDYDVHNTKNTIYLPTERANHSTRSIHKGYNRFHGQYNRDMRASLDEITEYGKANNWSKAQYHQALDDLANGTRKDLRDGKVKLHCNG